MVKGRYSSMFFTLRDPDLCNIPTCIGMHLKGPSIGQDKAFVVSWLPKPVGKYHHRRKAVGGDKYVE